MPGDLYRYRENEIPPYTLSVNGRDVSPTLEKGYAVLKRIWQAGDTVELKLPMPMHRVLANAEIEADRGRVVLERGPLVYCIEAIDNGGQARNVVLPESTELVPEHRPKLLGGVTVLRARIRQARKRPPLRQFPITPGRIGAMARCASGLKPIPRRDRLGDEPQTQINQRTPNRVL